MKTKHFTIIVSVGVNGPSTCKALGGRFQAAIQHLVDNGLLTNEEDELEEIHVDVKGFDGKRNGSPSMALKEFISTIETTGGLKHDGVSPVADPEWIDLGDAYIQACEALGHKPMIEESFDEDED